ncbi:M23 family metallopeptidase [Krasilnikovia sp. MM14-A1004]|uniref:M23 family metallopeptidase n=1 Tax=Krasilnikovia sp. MM14-A1004 TaxID=3373541 RepID=UPI00399CE4AE
MQHRAKHRVGGRHRRTDALHGHRAPRTPLVPLVVGERNRYAVVTAAALVAGVGVAGVAAATASSSGPATAAAKANLEPASRTQISPFPTPADPTPTATGLPAGAATGMPVPPQAGAAGLPGAPITLLPGSGTPQPAASGGQSGGGLSWQAPRRKTRPVPVTAAWVNPLPGAVTTSCFGERWGRMHEGVDLAGPDGTPIRAAGAGVIVAAGPAEGYGNAVLIDHGNGYLTHYGHMSKITVKVGQKVQAGEQIGNEGSTGHSTGPHLHFEVHEGHYKNAIEPTAWMHEHGVDIGGCGVQSGPPKD